MLFGSAPQTARQKLSLNNSRKEPFPFGCIGYQCGVKKTNQETARGEFEHQPVLFQAPNRREIRVTFDEPRLSSDAGLALLMQDPFTRGYIRDFASAISDRRSRHTHSIGEMVSQRVFQILAGYADGNDCDTLRDDPLFKLAAGRDADGPPLASQPTISRLENLPGKRDLIRLFYCQLDAFIATYATAPHAIVLDIDPTACLTHGQQELRLFNTHVGDYCLMPFHVYEGQTGKPVATILRPGKTPTAPEIIALLKRIVRHLRRVWPKVDIILRADSHHTKPAVMDWCEAHAVSFITGLGPNSKLNEQFGPFIRAAAEKYERNRSNGRAGEVVCVHASGDYQAGTWSRPRRVVCRVYHGPLGSDTRYIVTSFREAGARYLYDTVYCGRGAAELMIKEHKLGLESDRMSCTSATANQFRLYLHNIAYLILHRFRAVMLKGTRLARASFTRIRLELLKSAARITIRKTYVQLHLGVEHPLRDLWRALAARGRALRAAGS